MANLTTAKRNALPNSAFAEPKERKYPIEDASHARNALSRSSQFGSEALQTKVKKRIVKKFPGIKIGK